MRFEPPPELRRSAGFRSANQVDLNFPSISSETAPQTKPPRPSPSHSQLDGAASFGRIHLFAGCRREREPRSVQVELGEPPGIGFNGYRPHFGGTLQKPRWSVINAKYVR